MGGAWGYHNHTYFPRPHPVPHALSARLVRYLRGRSPALLLPLYAMVLAAGVLDDVEAAQTTRRGIADLFVPLLASTFLFFPLLQAYLQREFEVVVTFALAGALLALVNDRRSRPRRPCWPMPPGSSTSRCCSAAGLFLRKWWREAAVYVGGLGGDPARLALAVRSVAVLQQQRARPCRAGIRAVGIRLWSRRDRASVRNRLLRGLVR